MPELPEVETIARRLRTGCRGEPALPGARILSVEIRHPKPIACPAPEQAGACMTGRTFRGVSRRGKFLVFHLSQDHLLIHLRMSGDLQLFPRGEGVRKHDHVIWHLDNGWDLRFHDPRRFGRIWLIESPEEVLAGLGPEPLEKEFTVDRLHAMLCARKRLLKPLLLDQTFVAGIGNIYADESLHRARLHPLRRSNTLRREEAARLRNGIRAALRVGIAQDGASIDWAYRGGEFQNHFRAYDREGEPCVRCGAKIRRIVVGQRTTHYCPRCQKRKGDRRQ
ncbi:MAG: bifunctional DNA-formamidopyrimidine glycosylase/DNA-(apurinic or apyrimidinic site) lyase [Anaerolineales bacterium]|nr:bifunctional DNA-formamidopyrimidine glycosylase/DNA-(apurinic or apyrimidinic site) lyase [Anaerolineales bacterium]